MMALVYTYSIATDAYPFPDWRQSVQSTYFGGGCDLYDKPAKGTVVSATSLLQYTLKTLLYWHMHHCYQLLLTSEETLQNPPTDHSSQSAHISTRALAEKCLGPKIKSKLRKLIMFQVMDSGQITSVHWVQITSHPSFLMWSTGNRIEHIIGITNSRNAFAILHVIITGTESLPKNIESWSFGSAFLDQFF